MPVSINDGEMLVVCALSRVDLKVPTLFHRPLFAPELPKFFA
jgi:hypothetical protein